jgi:hypothetical protein
LHLQIYNEIEISTEIISVRFEAINKNNSFDKLKNKLGAMREKVASGSFVPQ